MSPNNESNEPIVVKVEFSASPTLGEENVNFRLKPKDLVEKSSIALKKAMDTIKAMAHEVYETVDGIPLTERPDEVSVEFGLKLTIGGDVLIANATTETQINVHLKWSREKPTKPDETSSLD